MRRVCALILVASAAALAGDELHAVLNASDFASAEGIQLAGSARLVDGALRLTPAERHQAGAAWLRARQPVAGGFETTFRFRVSNRGGEGGGADGFAFVLQNSGPGALGGRGSGGGFALGEDAGGANSAAIPQSIAVFFDTFRNAEIGDRSNNFVSISTAGKPAQIHWPPARLASSNKLAVNLKDHKVHTARIVYEAPVLSVYLDGAHVLGAAVDLSTVTGADGAAWAGFTASTGEGFENHDILSWSLSVASTPAVSSNISFLQADCLPDRNLCTPSHAIVSQTGVDRYHVILPGGSEGASLPNPDGHEIAISNARGSVCRNIAEPSPSDCRGAAALVQRTEGGRSYFKVELPGGAAETQGYLEFDAHVD